MAASFADLIVPQTAAEIEETILAGLKLAGFPTTSWASGSVPRRLVEGFAAVLASVWLIVAMLALGCFLETSSGAWLTFLARNTYQVERGAATKAAGVFRFTNDSGAPVAIAALQYLIADSATGLLVFRNTDDGGSGGSIADGAFADVAVEAVTAGADWNIPNGTALALVTDVPGVTITNPAYLATGTWITSAGGDEQTDASLRLSCSSKWATLGTGSPPAAYIAWALAAAPTLTRVKVDDANPSGPGTIELILANSAGGASANELLDVQTYVDPRVPAGAVCGYTAAVNLPVTVTGTVRVRAANRDAAEAAVTQAFIDLAASIDIGGNDDATLYGAEILELVMAPAGVVNFTPLPSDVAIARDEVPVFTLDLTWVEI